MLFACNVFANRTELTFARATADKRRVNTFSLSVFLYRQPFTTQYKVRVAKTCLGASDRQLRQRRKVCARSLKQQLHSEVVGNPSETHEVIDLPLGVSVVSIRSEIERWLSAQVVTPTSTSHSACSGIAFLGFCRCWRRLFE
jgi:hypothetical protein